MMDPYLWQRSQDGAGVAGGHNSSSMGERTSHPGMNNVNLNAHSHAHPVSNGVEWSSDFGYVNGSSQAPEHHSMQHAVPQNLYAQNWSATPYDAYNGYNGGMPSNITPAALLAQSAQSHTNRNHSQAEAPTTIDPTLMMTMQPGYGQYSYQHPSMPQMARMSSYENYPVSSLSGVLEFQDGLDSPATPNATLPNSGNTSASEANANTGSSTPGQSKGATSNGSAMALDPSSTIPLIVRIEALLTPQRLDKDPQGTCKALINLLIPEGAEEPTPVDTETRAVILSRLRDHAPEGFFTVLVRDIDMLVVLKEWGKNAIKKDTFAGTLTGWLQVIDRLPMTYKALSESGLGKVVQYIVEHPPTTATKDTAARITAGWKRLLPATQAPGKSEPDSRSKTLATEKSKKRKAEDVPIKTTTSMGNASIASTSGPATKKAAVATPAGTKAVRRDGSTATKATPTTSAATTSSTSTTTASAKAANADSSFFSSKPKAKLPSFRKKPSTEASALSGGDMKTEDADSKIAHPQPQAANNDWNPFADALKAVRKGSPVVTAVGGGGENASGEDRKPGISSRTGKPKKIVRFKEGVELEMVKFIEKAIYDDDMSGGSILHGQSWRDLDRSEGSLLKHMIAEIDWYDPPAVSMDPLIPPTNRGESSAEAKVQAERENTALAAVYQGNPPDTPIEPPHLVNLPPIDESSTKSMILGQKVEEELQIGLPGTQATANFYLNQLGAGAGSGDPNTLGAMNVYAQQMGGAMPGSQGATPQVTELLSKIMQSIGGTGDGFGAPPSQPPIASFNQPPVSNNALGQTGLLNALMAANSAFGANGQPGYGANGFDTPYGAGAGYDPAQTFGGGESPSIAMMLPPPLHSGIPGRDDDEDRWKKGTKGAGPGGKKGKGPWKDVPASQNTRRPLCTFFAQGRCRFGEECTFSHDASKLGKGS